MASKFDVPGWLVLALGLVGVGAVAGSYWLVPTPPAPASTSLRSPAGRPGALPHGVGLGLVATATALAFGRYRQQHRHRDKLATENTRRQQLERSQRLVLETMPDGVVLVDVEDRVHFLNAAAERLSGWTATEAAGEPVSRVLGLVAGEASTAPPAGGAVPGGGSSEHLLRSRRGAVTPVDIHSIPIPDGAQGAAGRLVFIRDLSPTKAVGALLEEARRRLGTLAANAPGMAYRCRPDLPRSWEYVSEGCLALTGLGPEALLGEPDTGHASLVHPEDRSQVEQEIATALREGRSFGVTYRLVAGDRPERFVQDQGRGVAGRTGSVVAVEGFVMDITERQAAERALAESERKYRELVENAGEGVFVAQDGRLVFANRRTGEMLGYDRAELCSRPFEEFIHPEDRALVVRRHARRLGGHTEPDAYAFRFVDRQGGARWAELRTVAVTWRGRPATLNYASDITARRQAEAALLEAEDRYRRMFENAPIAYQSLDREARILAVNAAWLELFGYPQDEVIGTPVVDYLTPASRTALAPRLAMLLTSRRLEPTELDFQHKDGRIVHVVAEGRATCDARGEFLQTHFTLYDVTERQRAEEALRRSEQGFREIFDATEEAILINDVDTGEIRDANASAVRRFSGAGKSALLGTRFAELLADGAADTPERVQDWIRRALDDGPCTFVWAGHDRDGAAVHLEITLKRVAIAGRGSLLAVARDITDRKQAEAQLRLQATALEAEANAILITDPAGQIQWANRAFSERSGYTKAEVIGRNPRELIRSGHHPRAYYKNLWETILAGKVWRGVIINRRKDGSHYTEENTITPVRDEQGTITHFIAIQQDVTERERSEAERDQMLHHIWEQTAQMTRIMQCAPAAVALLAPDGRVLLSNTRADDEFNREPGLLIDNRLLRLGDHTLEALLQPPTQHGWHEVRVQNRTLEAMATPVDADETSPSGWVLVFHDVTQSREVRRALERHERLSAIGQLAAGIAHDFNNIAQVIVLHIQLLKGSPRLTPGDHEHLTAINNKAIQASTMIQQILDFSRRTSLDRQVIDLAALCRDEAALLRRTLPGRIAITFDHDGTDCRVNADANRLRQVLMNLAFNARDAMPTGGELRLRVASIEVESGQAPPVTGLNPGRWVRVAVTDSGAGMTPEVQKHLFEPFYTTKSAGKGTGLGLAQVHGIITQHGGHIQVVSQPQAGTTFSFYLPGVVPSPETKPAPKPTAPTAPTPSTILVVEDDNAVRGVLLQILAAMGHQCIEAANGLQALAQLRGPDGARVELVLSDWRMPGMDGATLFRTLRSQGSPIPMILLSGFAAHEELQPLLAEGLAGWLPKPLDLPRLADLIARTLARHREG